MEKVIATSNLTPKFKWWDWQNPLSFVRKVVEQHPQWEVVEEKKELHYQLIKTTFLVIKNKTGVLDYDPHLMIMLDGTTIYIAPAKSYDSSKEWYKQSGTLNNNGNYIRLGASGGGYSDGVLVPKITSILLNDYSLVFSLNYTDHKEYNYFNNYLKFEIFDATDIHSSGMIVQNKSYYYIYANNIWYGKDYNNIFSRQGKIDIDKPVGTYHKPNAQGSFNATKRTFYINTKTDPQQDPIWQYIGRSFVFYAYADSNYHRPRDDYYPYLYFYIAEGIFVRTKDDNTEKEYFISALDHQVNESSIVETPHIIEEYNKLQSDFFATPTYYTYYWKLNDSINEVDGRANSSEDDNWYYLYNFSTIYNWTVHFTVKRTDTNDTSVITYQYYTYSHLYLTKNTNTGKYYLKYYDNHDYIQISNEFTFNAGDTKTITVACRGGYTRVFVDGENMSSGNNIQHTYINVFHLRKAFGEFSEVRFFKSALVEDEILRLHNNNPVSKSLYTL